MILSPPNRLRSVMAAADCGNQRLTASYMHFYFPSNPAAAAALFLP